MAKLTKQQWANARARWERSSKDGFEWLASELGIARPTVAERAKNENWAKKPTQEATKPTQKTTVALNVETREEIGKFLKINGKYHESFPDIAYRLCLWGASDGELATLFRVCEVTLDNWRDKYHDLDNRINEARMLSGSLVAESVFKSALGMHGTIEEREVLGSDGQIVVLKTKKTLPPSFNQQRYFLNNRSPEKWKDNVVVKEEVNINIFPSAEELNRVYQKTLEEAKNKFKPLIENRLERMGIVIDDIDDE